MATKVLAPRMGEGVNELTIVRWLKQEGDSVKELEPLLEVETDKVVTEIPSPAGGTLLKRSLSENEVAQVGMVVGWIGQPGEQIPGGTEPAMEAVPAQASKTGQAREDLVENAPGEPAHEANGRGFISPVVARIASERGVDLARVQGTGLGGRITKKDILQYLETGPVLETGSAVEAKPAIPAGPVPQAAPGDQVVPLSVIRRSIAEHMIRSKETSAHVLTAMEADLSRVVAHMAANKEAYSRDGLKLTYTSYFVMAIVAGLKTFPLANSSWSEAGLILHHSYNIGMATSLGEEGLIVPVIKDADRLSLAGITRAVNDLSARARAKKLTPAEVKGGTFTLTNHGISGSIFAMPIINQPQCGILGTGAIQKRPVVVTDENGNDAIAIRPMVYLSFVFDHRILDGAMADVFLSRVVESLEKWQ